MNLFSVLYHLANRLSAGGIRQFFQFLQRSAGIILLRRAYSYQDHTLCLFSDLNHTFAVSS